MTNITPLSSSQVAKGDTVAIASVSPDSAKTIAYEKGTITAITSKLIIVETLESEMMFSLDGIEKKQGKTKLAIYSLDSLEKHNQAIEDAKLDYRFDLCKEINGLLESLTTVRLEKLLKLARGE